MLLTRVSLQEHIEGLTLKKMIKDNDLTIEDKNKLIGQILDVFSFLHKKEVFHGDIHASNFIVDNELNVKLIDFGLSNHHKLNGEERLNNGGVFKYIPPERLSENAFKIVNKQRADYRSEVYQIGVLIYFIVYEKFPHEVQTWKSLYHLIKNKDAIINVLTPKKEVVSNPVISLLTRCLTKKPLERYKDAVQLRNSWNTK